MTTNHNRSINALLRRAYDAFEAEEYLEVEALTRRVLMRDERSFNARDLLATTLIETDRFVEALEVLEQLLELAPDDATTYADIGICCFMLCEFDKASAALRHALRLDPEERHAQYHYGLCLERAREYERADEYFLAAHHAEPEEFPAPTRMGRREFQRIVNAAIDEIPAEIRDEMKGLTIIVDDLPAEDDLLEENPPLDPCALGLYVGVPLPERQIGDPPRQPDTVFIYQRNLERFCGDEEALRQEIRITLLHEVGHYLGYDEQDLEERGLA
jgi:predicted Zn-dependent protease with MMP-like domain